MICSAHEITLLVTGLLVSPGKSNVEHAEVYEYNLMNGIISKAANNHDFGYFRGKILDYPGLTRVLMGRCFQCFESRKA